MNKIKEYWIDLFHHNHSPGENEWWKRKKLLWEERHAQMIRIKGNIHFFSFRQYDEQQRYEYLLYLSFLTKQKGLFYLEERVVPHRCEWNNGEFVNHMRIPRSIEPLQDTPVLASEMSQRNQRQSFTYDRRKAVQYAERWWNSYHPNFEHFTVDCTNFVSQCLFAGGAPMRGAPERDAGWWYQNKNWSFSWSVAHSLKWYLSGSTQGLQGKEVETAVELAPGDIICYDFQGDGRWDHNTIVVAKDVNGMPLVNAHTDNSRHRYWSYEDSTAWTPHIKYKFYQIGEM